MGRPSKTAVAELLFLLTSFFRKYCKLSSRLHESSIFAVLKIGLVVFFGNRKYAELQFYRHERLVLSMFAHPIQNQICFQNNVFPKRQCLLGSQTEIVCARCDVLHVTTPQDPVRLNRRWTHAGPALGQKKHLQKTNCLQKNIIFFKQIVFFTKKQITNKS